jgi:hypothetical protein
MTEPRVPFYDRLPEIHRVWDAEQTGPTALRAYLALVEDALGAIHQNIESLYHDFFIETCDDWVVPYIADLLGTSHLSGDPWSLRAEVADTIVLRRRKGTLAAVERLTYDLTGWGVHAVELRRNLAWSQHLNHQRPDAGGEPPYAAPAGGRFTFAFGGTATVRDPATLSLIGSPFDPFAHLPDLRPPASGNVRYNLPNLAIFLWRLEAYTVGISDPLVRDIVPGPGTAGAAGFVVRLDVHPLGRPVRLFNRSSFDPDRRPPVVSELDGAPGPIHPARLTSRSPSGNPAAYTAIEAYDPADLRTLQIAPGAGLQLHVPALPFEPIDPAEWTFRGANLCAWEEGLAAPLAPLEVAIDPVIGRIAVGVKFLAEAEALRDDLRLTYTYGAAGPVGAHPVSRTSEWPGPPLPNPIRIDRSSPMTLADALGGLPDAAGPTLIEIADSRIHDLDLDPLLINGIHTADGEPALSLAHPLILRAADGERPIVRLARPLRFRPADPANAAAIVVRLEGLFLTRSDSFPAGQPLIARAAVNSLEIFDSTLDPGGHRVLDGTAEGVRADIEPAVVLAEPYGFADPAEEVEFDQTPELHLQRSVTGPLLLDSGYRLFLTNAIVDAGGGVGDDPGSVGFALSGATGNAAEAWGPHTTFEAVTCFGRVRVERIDGRGGIFIHRLEVRNHQQGCIKFSDFSGDNDRLPQNHACIRGADARLRFDGEWHGEPAYGRLADVSDFRLRERGPGDDAMGAFGEPLDVLEAHKRRNLQIRFREFIPIGVRPLIIPVT